MGQNLPNLRRQEDLEGHQWRSCLALPAPAIFRRSILNPLSQAENNI